MEDNSKSKKNTFVSFKLIFTIIIIGGFFGIFMRSITHKPETSIEQTKKGIPVFSLPLLYDQSKFITNDDIKKNAPLLLNVWASWCAPCRNEHKVITKLSKDYNIKIYGLNYKDNVSKAQDFLKRYGNPYTNIVNDTNGLTTLNWGIRGVPETFLISKNGQIIYRHKGEIHENDIAKIVKLYHDDS